MVTKKTSPKRTRITAAIREIPPDPGTYALVYRCDAPFWTGVGKLGQVFLCAGHWIYIGSAFGPGGLKSRLGHHLKPSAHPHWHLDYVKHALEPVEIWFTTAIDKREHIWAKDLSHLRGAGCPIDGFGASDCACRAHLIHLRRRPGFTAFKRRTGDRLTRILL